MVLHTMSSFIPKTFSISSGITINIAFFVLAQILLFCLVKKLTNSEAAAVVITTVIGLAPGIINMVMFIRMYMMVSCWVLLISLLFSQYQMNYKINIRFYLKIMLASTLGALTHYYFLIFLFFMCAFHGVYLLFHKRFKEIIVFVGSMCGAGILSIAIFPAITRHIFKGGRGKEAFSNAANMTDFLDKVNGCFKIVSEEIFYKHSFFWGIIFLISSVIIIYLYLKERKYSEYIRNYVSIAGSCVLYFLIVAKIAPYYEDRYFMPAYYPALCVLFVTIYIAAISITKKTALIKKVCAVFFLAWMLLGLYKPHITYLYRETASNIQWAKEHRDEHALYVHDNRSWLFNCMLMEYRYYEDFTFLHHARLDMLKNSYWSTAESMVVSIDMEVNADKIFERIMKINPNITQYEQVGTFHWVKTYYLH